MKKLILIIAFLTLYLPAQSQYISGLIDTLWLEYPNDAVVYSNVITFHPSGDSYVAYGGGIWEVDSLNSGLFSIVESATGIVTDTLFSDSTVFRQVIMDFFPNGDSLLIRKEFYQHEDSVKRLCIYDLNTKTIVNTIRPQLDNYPNQPGIGALLSFTGDTIIIPYHLYNPATRKYDEFLELWEINNNTLLAKEKCNGMYVKHISPNGQYLTLGSSREGQDGGTKLMYLDSLYKGICENWISTKDTNFPNSEWTFSMISPSGRFVLAGDKQYIYDAVNQEGYLSFDLEDYKSNDDKWIRFEPYCFLDDRHILFGIYKRDTVLNEYKSERWVFDIETSQIVHKEAQSFEEYDDFYVRYDPVGNHLLYYGYENRARMYKINVNLLYGSGIIKQQKFDDLIYPNPASDQIEILLDRPGIFKEIIIVNMNGQAVNYDKSDYFITNDKITVNTKKLTKGTYIIKVVENERQRTFKLLINK